MSDDGLSCYFFCYNLIKFLKFSFVEIDIRNPKFFIFAYLFYLTTAYSVIILEKYNDYLKTNGGIIGEATCDRTAKPTDARRITEKTHLIKFLSHESEDVTKYDWLSVVLMDIVSE